MRDDVGDAVGIAGLLEVPQVPEEGGGESPVGYAG